MPRVRALHVRSSRVTSRITRGAMRHGCIRHALAMRSHVSRMHSPSTRHALIDPRTDCRASLDASHRFASPLDGRAPYCYSETFVAGAGATRAQITVYDTFAGERIARIAGKRAAGIGSGTRAASRRSRQGRRVCRYTPRIFLRALGDAESTPGVSPVKGPTARGDLTDSSQRVEMFITLSGGVKKTFPTFVSDNRRSEFLGSPCALRSSVVRLHPERSFLLRLVQLPASST
jgi:hypothetical protein